MTEKTITLRVLDENERTRIVRLYTYNADATTPQYRVLGPAYRAEQLRCAKTEWGLPASPAMVFACEADPASLESLRFARDSCREELNAALAAGEPLSAQVVAAHDTLTRLLTIDGADLP